MSAEQTSAGRDAADAKAWFYLDHRHDIEEWAALRPAARELVERSLRGLEDRLEEWCADIGAEPYAKDLVDGAWPRLGASRARWRYGTTSDVTILIEWVRGRLLSPGSQCWPYVGVRISPAQTDSARRQQVAQAVAPLRSGHGFNRSSAWPAYRYVEPPLVQRLDPDALAHRCWSELEAVWGLAAPLLDAAIPRSPSNDAHQER